MCGKQTLWSKGNIICEGVSCPEEDYLSSLYFNEVGEVSHGV